MKFIPKESDYHHHHHCLHHCQDHLRRLQDRQGGREGQEDVEDCDFASLLRFFALLRLSYCAHPSLIRSLDLFRFSCCDNASLLSVFASLIPAFVYQFGLFRFFCDKPSLLWSFFSLDPGWDFSNVAFQNGMIFSFSWYHVISSAFMFNLLKCSQKWSQ